MYSPEHDKECEAVKVIFVLFFALQLQIAWTDLLLWNKLLIPWIIYVFAVPNLLILSFIFLSVHCLFLSFEIETKYFLSKRLQEGCNVDLTLLYRFCQELYVESRGCVCGRQGFILFARDCSGVKSADQEKTSTICSQVTWQDKSITSRDKSFTSRIRWWSLVRWF